MTLKDLSEIMWQLGRISGLVTGSDVEDCVLEAVEVIENILEKCAPVVGVIGPSDIISFGGKG